MTIIVASLPVVDEIAGCNGHSKAGAVDKFNIAKRIVIHGDARQHAALKMGVPFKG